MVEFKDAEKPEVKTLHISDVEVAQVFQVYTNGYHWLKLNRAFEGDKQFVCLETGDLASWIGSTAIRRIIPFLTEGV
jgi:hypothetical protein